MVGLIVLAALVFGGIWLFALLARVIPIAYNVLVYKVLGGDKD